MESNGHANGLSGFTDDTKCEKPIHLLFVPMVQQAHAVTAVRFVKKLSQRGLVVTLVMIKQHTRELFRVYNREALQKLGIHVEVLDGYHSPAIPLPVSQSPVVRTAFQPFAVKLIANKNAGLPGPTCLLGDRFLPWLEDLAKELDIPRFTYNSNAAITARLMQLYHDLGDEMRAIPQDPDWFQNSFELIRKQPGFEFLKRATDIPKVLVSYEWFDFFCEVGRGLASTNGVILNSFFDLEREFLERMRNASAGNTKFRVPPYYPVGPLSTVEEFNNEIFIEGMEDSHGECTQWLGTQPPLSVLYICLGSQVRLFASQILHLAQALESTQQRFLWVLTKGGGNFYDVSEVLPAGFLKRVDGRGKIVTGWVGQLELLSDPSIGGFLSHCGWQSLVESLTCGVPMLGWPQVSEQRLNCRFMQEVLKVALRVTEKEEGELVEQREFEEVIRNFMSKNSKETTVVRENVAKMKELCAATLAEGGPSDVALDEFVQSIVLQSQKKN